MDDAWDNLESSKILFDNRKYFASTQTLREHASYGAYDDYSEEKASSRIKCAEELVIKSNDLLKQK